MAPIDHAALDQAIRDAERERCAKIADRYAADAASFFSSPAQAAAAAQLAQRIAWSIRVTGDNQP